MPTSAPLALPRPPLQRTSFSAPEKTPIVVNLALVCLFILFARVRVEGVCAVIHLQQLQTVGYDISMATSHLITRILEHVATATGIGKPGQGTVDFVKPNYGVISLLAS